MTDQPRPESLHAVIVGCGRVGSGMTERLLVEGYTVSVIDANPDAFKRVEHLDVAAIVGMGYDRATMIQAGIERAEILAAVTSGDNSNIVVARTAAEHFRVPKVIARIYDPRRAAIYERLGIPTVASAQLTTELAIRRVLPDDTGVRWIEPSARVCVVERSAPPHLVGQPLVSLERSGMIRAVAVRRLGIGIIATPDLVVQEGDVLYFAVANDQLDTVDQVLQPDVSKGTH